jgi:hypothetical protein
LDDLSIGYQTNNQFQLRSQPLLTVDEGLGKDLHKIST